MKTSDSVNEASALNSGSEGEDLDPLRCWDCNINFTTKDYLYEHLYHHIKQPKVILNQIQLPPLKITIKNTSGKSFEIINSPTFSGDLSPFGITETVSNLAEIEDEKDEGLEPSFEPEFHDVNSDNGENIDGDGNADLETMDSLMLVEDDEANVSFSPNFAQVDVPPSPANSDSSVSGKNKIEESEGDGAEYGNIPGAEPTPPPEPSPEYPKIRIKTTGLLKEPLTITEITDDNPDGDSEFNSDIKKPQLWNNSMEDPLKLPGTDDILSLFNNNDRAKDFGFTTSNESEFMPLDRLDSRNQLQLYNPNQSNQNPLSNLTGLPMEALAQQVSRLQPPSNGMHQQNVLINIQQFPQAPAPPPPYQHQPPPMHHYPPPPQMYPQPYQPYPTYYPAAPAQYPPQHMPPPQPQLQMGQPPLGQPPMPQPQVSQPQSMPPHTQPYRQPMPMMRQPAPRQMVPQQRMPVNHNRQPLLPRQQQPMTRPRAPMIRPRGAGMTPLRNVRPRMPGMQNGQVRPQQAIKRTPEQIQALQAKKKRFDVLTPDKDDEDCQVICMQPKNTDGGLPQIQSVQGGTSESAESSIMHLSDSITLSVRNPQPRPQSPKKSDAKAVANILATRGITVTATPKAKEKEAQKNSPSLPASLNLNGAVSIIPSAKPSNGKANQESHLPTVDLTDDSTGTSQASIKNSNSPQKNPQRTGLPFKCDLCPAQYPNAIGLSKHRQNYHKTSSGMCEIGVPLINLKQPGIFQKLSTLGILNYIPLPSSGSEGMFALPIINGRSPGNIAALGATSMLTLGPVRNIPRPQNGVQNVNKTVPNHK